MIRTEQMFIRRQSGQHLLEVAKRHRIRHGALHKNWSGYQFVQYSGHRMIKITNPFRHVREKEPSRSFAIQWDSSRRSSTAGKEFHAERDRKLEEARKERQIRRQETR